MKKLLYIPFIALTGCAYLSSHTVTPIYQVVGTNIMVSHATTDARSWTLFDAQSQLAKFRNSNGGPTNTYTSGTVASGVSESSTSSNIVAIINAASTAYSKAP